MIQPKFDRLIWESEIHDNMLIAFENKEISKTDFMRFREILDNIPSVDPIDWHPYPKEIPSYGKYLTTCVSSCGNAFVRILSYGDVGFEETKMSWYFDDSEYGDVAVDNVIAWTELPAPCKADGK